MEPEMTSTLDHGRQLVSNESLSSDCRKEVSQDVKYLDERWRTLLKKTEDEYARYAFYREQAYIPLQHNNSSTFLVSFFSFFINMFFV